MLVTLQAMMGLASGHVHVRKWLHGQAGSKPISLKSKEIATAVTQDKMCLKGQLLQWLILHCPLPLLSAKDNVEIAISWSAKASLVADV